MLIKRVFVASALALDGGEEEDEPARPRRRARAQRPDPDEALEEQGQDLELR